MQVALVVAFFTGSFITAVISLIVYKSSTKKLRKLAYTDMLTELPNHHKFMNDLAVSFNNLAFKPLSIVILDLDNFKKVNDKYGYSVGDEYLNFFARFAEIQLDTNFIIYRYKMGDEFVLLSKYDENHTKEKVNELKLSFSKHAKIEKGFENTGFAYGISAVDFSELHSCISQAEEGLRKAKSGH